MLDPEEEAPEELPPDDVPSEVVVAPDEVAAPEDVPPDELPVPELPPEEDPTPVVPPSVEPPPDEHPTRTTARTIPDHPTRARMAPACTRLREPRPGGQLEHSRRMIDCRTVTRLQEQAGMHRARVVSLLGLLWLACGGRASGPTGSTGGSGANGGARSAATANSSAAQGSSSGGNATSSTRTSTTTAPATTGSIGASTSGGSSGSSTAAPESVQHYEYVFPPYEMDVYDLDHGFAQVESVPMPEAAAFRGVVASPATGQLFVSYGSFGGPGGQLSQYDLATNELVWSQTYDFGIDSMSLTPDGKTLYMPTGWSSPGGLWEVLAAATGEPVSSINTSGTGPHNTIVSLDGSKVAMGPGYSDYLFVADTRTNALVSAVGPLADGVRPFTLNGKATLAFMTTTGFLGFYVGDLATGQILYTVPVPGFTSTAVSTSHGISLSPDETELYLIDYGNNYVHVFDPTGLPGAIPVDIADIKLQTPMTDEGWLQHTRDGRFVVVGDCGDVIDTSLRTIVGNLPAAQGTRIFTEIDFENGAVVFSPQSRNQGGYVTQ